MSFESPKHEYLVANHRPFAEMYADEAERLAASGFYARESFTASDIHKCVYEAATSSIFALTATSPAQWTRVSRPARFVIKSLSATAYSLKAEDEVSQLVTEASATVTITVPTNATVPINVGTRVHVIQSGAGLITWTGSSAVEINARNSATHTLGVHSIISFNKIGTNKWLVTGNMGTP